MSDADNKYMSFWKRRLPRSSSSPALSRKSGRLSKDAISGPYPGDPNSLRPINSRYEASPRKEKLSRSAERLSKSRGNGKESKWYENHLDGSHVDEPDASNGHRRSRSVSHLVGKETTPSLPENGIPGLEKANSLRPINGLYGVPSGRAGRVDSAERIASYHDSGKKSKLHKVHEEGSDSKERWSPDGYRRIQSASQLTGKQVASSSRDDRALSSKNDQASLSLSSLGAERNQKSKDLATGKQNETQKKDEDMKTKIGWRKKQEADDDKHGKRKLSFGLRFRSGKRSPSKKSQQKGKKQNKSKDDLLGNPNDTSEQMKDGSTTLDTDDQQSTSSNKYSAADYGYFLPDCDPEDENNYGSPIYDIMTPTEIYERRSSIRTSQGTGSPRDPRNQQRPSEVDGRHFDFDAQKIKIRQTSPTQNTGRNLKSQKIYGTISRISEAPNENELEFQENEELSTVPPSSVQDGEPTENYTKTSDQAAEIHDKTLQVNSSDQSQEILVSEPHTSNFSTASSPLPELKKVPAVINHHQNVIRSSSEPKEPGVALQVHKPLSRTQSEALQPILDEHLQKHNVKVAAELGIEVDLLPGTNTKAVEMSQGSDDITGDVPKTSIPAGIRRKRPTSLTLPKPTDDPEHITPLSSLDHDNRDPRTRLSFQSQTSKSTSSTHTVTSKKKPAPPVRSPTTKITTVQIEESTSNQTPVTNHDSSPIIVQNRYVTTKQQTHQGPNQEVLRRSGSQTSIFVIQGTPKDGKLLHSSMGKSQTSTLPYHGRVLKRQQYTTEYMTAPRKTKIPLSETNWKVIDSTDGTPIDHSRVPRNENVHSSDSRPAVPPPVIVGAIRKPQPRRWSLELADLKDADKDAPHPSGRITQQSEGVYDLPRNRRPPPPPFARPTFRPPSERDMAKAAVTNWVAHRLAQFHPDVQSMYVGQRMSYKVHPNLSYHPPTIYEEMEEDVYQTFPPRKHNILKTKSSSDSDHSVGGLRTASLDRLGRRSHAHPAAHAHAHSHTPHYTLPRRPHNAQRYSQLPAKGKGYGYSPPSAVFDDDPGIMSEAETSSTGFRRGGKQRASLPLSRQSSSKTIDSRNFEMDDNNSYWDEDPGIMSEAETSSTGRGRNAKPRTSLPIVRTPSKTLERPLGLVFLQFRGETKRALLPNEITSLDTVKALFVRSFPNQLTMQYLDLPSVKIYIHDSNKDMFYDLEELGGTCFIRDIRDRSVLRVFEGEGVNGQGGGAWDQDQSYFSEPEFDSDYQQQHVHKSKSGKSGGYYMTHSYPPGAPAHTAGVAPIPRGPRPQYSPERMHGDGYLSSPERSPRPYGGGGSAYMTPTPSYEDPYYGGGQYGSRSGSVTPIIDEEARSAFYSMRVEQMERQLASLTGLVQKALHTGVGGSPRPEHITLAPPPAVVAAAAAAGQTNSREAPPTTRASNEFLQVPASSSSFKGSAEKQPIKPAIKCSTLPRMSSQDMRLSPEVYNQLRVLQKKAKELRTDVRNLRRTSQANALTMKEILKDTVAKITTLLQSNEECLLPVAADGDRVRIQREEDSYRQDMSKLDKDLCDLELKVEELRNNVINRRLRVNMSDVENMALILSRSSKTVADLKARFPSLQDGLKGLISAEMEKAIKDEKFLKEEPDKLESALRRCKKLTGTLVTLKRLASVQEQRVPPNTPGVGPLVGVANGDPRATSPTLAEEARSSASKVCVGTPPPALTMPAQPSVTYTNTKTHPPLSRKRTPTSL